MANDYRLLIFKLLLTRWYIYEKIETKIFLPIRFTVIMKISIYQLHFFLLMKNENNLGVLEDMFLQFKTIKFK